MSADDSTPEPPTATPTAYTDADVEWAAVCDCGWAISTTGTTIGRSRIEAVGRTHDKRCSDTVRLERRGDEETEHVRDLQGGTA